MANFILIHGIDGNPEECFYPWLRRQLEKEGHKIHTLQFPLPPKASLNNWLKTFKPCSEFVNPETVFVGRSIGPAFILRLLEKSDVKVKAAFLVAGFCSSIELPQHKYLIKPMSTFINKPFEWQKIRSHCYRFFIYNSDNDPFVPLKRGKELAKNLGAELTLVKGAEHFWFEEFPQLLKDIENL
ncbi:alpha/beta hydrolase [Candidatus Woesearchaeota archaeon]|nr:alpha/beta hydrolase [Candidatus Woesearchaeota archaeon]